MAVSNGTTTPARRGNAAGVEQQVGRRTGRDRRVHRVGDGLVVDPGERAAACAIADDDGVGRGGALPQRAARRRGRVVRGHPPNVPVRRYTRAHNHGSPVSRAERKRSTLRPSNLIRIMPAQGGENMHASASPSTATSSDAAASRSAVGVGRLRWRVVDIVVASVIGVASGLIFLLWNIGYLGPKSLLDPLLPGMQGLLDGPWLFAGVLGALIIRKPGAAIYTETLAAVVSALVGNQWGGFLTLEAGSSRVSEPSSSSCCSSTGRGSCRSRSSPAPARRSRGHQQPDPLVRRGRRRVHRDLPDLHHHLGRRHRRSPLVGARAGLAATGALDRFAAGRERRDLV
jgi:energy-coupling factor transport system substrate-specific component